MKREFRVIARSVDYYSLDIEAEDENEAEDIAFEIDPGEWDLQSGGSWEIDSVELKHTPQP